MQTHQARNQTCARRRQEHLRQRLRITFTRQRKGIRIVPITLEQHNRQVQFTPRFHS